MSEIAPKNHIMPDLPCPVCGALCRADTVLRHAEQSTRPPSLVDREAVARIIDPMAFENFVGDASKVYRQAQALKKADAIRALSSATAGRERTISVSEYLSDYEFRGEGGDYTPADDEKEVIEDAIEGYLGTLRAPVSHP